MQKERFKAPRRVFDAHFHLGAYGTQPFEGHAITPIPAELDHAIGADCKAYLDRHALTGGVIVPTYLARQEAAFEYNELVLEAVAQYPQLVGGLWVSPLLEVEELLEKALDALPAPGIRALKIASNTWQPYSINPATWTPQLRRQMERILSAASTHNLIIHFHTGYLPGAHPLEFEQFLKSYGTAARYQLVHMGEAIAPAFAFVPRFIEWIEAGYEVYTDTSIVPGFGPGWLIKSLMKAEIGLERVFFATDAPWGRFEEAYAKIAALPLDEQQLDALFYRNAIRAYGVSSS